MLELLHLFADAAGGIFLGLLLANLADGILNLAVGLCQHLFGLLLGTPQYGLALLLNLLNTGLQLLPAGFQSRLMLGDGLALAFPVALVAHDVL